MSELTCFLQREGEDLTQASALQARFEAHERQSLLGHLAMAAVMLVGVIGTVAMAATTNPQDTLTWCLPMSLGLMAGLGIKLALSNARDRLPAPLYRFLNERDAEWERIPGAPLG